MGITLNDIPAGQTFEQFCDLIRSNLISDDSSAAPPTNRDIRCLFDLYDLDRDGVLSPRESKAANKDLIQKINDLRCALIVVDFQNDFVAGSLAIKHGPARQDPIEALEPLNHLLRRHAHFRRIIYTLDWHPSNHISFYEHCRNSDRTLSKEDKIRKLKPFDTVKFDNPNFKQTLYPTHCVQGSWGAELCPDLIRAESAKYVQKGSQVFVDAYSGFVDNQGEYRSELEPILREEKIEALFICGLALDICVSATARDAAKLKFLTAVILDCSKGLTHEQINEKCEELRALNVAMIDSTVVEEFLDSHKMPWRWVCQLAGIPFESASAALNRSTQNGIHELNHNSTANGHASKPERTSMHNGEAHIAKGIREANEVQDSNFVASRDDGSISHKQADNGITV
ncbi:isochorismatase family domain-containing protein [Ditylenchus destructor]|uniref:nicotinamidase n=1 Tax=Ditylenchus destructor TaxID=166010 RepID=A0AAD4NK27_9BILA|nr:isochorismatase family domain-containing protein [Ditylenchus destructor]